MKIALTGATGKIGRHLTHDLLTRGHEVRAMIRPTRKGFWGNSTPAVNELKSWGADLFEADFADDQSLKAFATGTEILIHNGYHHVDEDQHPAEWTNLNTLASIKLYEYFWKASGKQIIFISSGAVYGHGPDHEQQKFPNTNLPIDEQTPRAPRGFYAAYKAHVEDATAIFKTVHGLAPSTSLRPMGDGVNQLLGFRAYDDKGFLTPELNLLLAGKPATLQLPPEITCTDGRDLANACHLLITKGQSHPNEIADWYLVGNTPITRNRFTEVFHEFFPTLPLQIQPIPQPRPSTDQKIRTLGYTPRTSEQTLRDHLQELAQKLTPRPNN